MPLCEGLYPTRAGLHQGFQRRGVPVGVGKGECQPPSPTSTGAPSNQAGIAPPAQPGYEAGPFGGPAVPHMFSALFILLALPTAVALRAEDGVLQRVREEVNVERKSEAKRGDSDRCEDSSDEWAEMRGQF